MNISQILKAASIFAKHAQQAPSVPVSSSPNMPKVESEADRVAEAQGVIFTALGIRNGQSDDASTFFNTYIVPWVNKEFEDGNAQAGSMCGTKVVLAPNSVRIVGTINGKEGPNSSSAFRYPTGIATQAMRGKTIPSVEFWISSPQKMG